MVRAVLRFIQAVGGVAVLRDIADVIPLQYALNHVSLTYR